MSRFATIIAAMAAAAAFLSCQKESDLQKGEAPDTVPETTVPSTVPVLFSAGTEGTVTRTDLSSNGDGTYSVLWKAGDKINVNGRELELATSDQPEGYGPGQSKGQFTGVSPTPASSGPKYKAIYPSALRDRYGYFNLPAEQPYVAAGIDGFPMYAEADEPSLSFKNLCGVILIKLKGSKSVSSITLADKGETPKPMSGRFSVADDAAVLASGANGTSLICDTPVELNTETFTPFYITVPAATYGKLHILIEASDGTICSLKSKNPIEVVRSMVSPIELSNPSFRDESAKITYTTSNTSKLNKYEGGADASVFGDGLTVVSHDYDSETRTGVITFSGPVTTIGYYAFRSSNLKTATIPNTVTSIGERGFGECSNLESVNFPRSLTVLGKQAFVNCSKFVPEDMSHITSIGEEALMSTNITGTLTIWEGLDYLGPKAFKYFKGTEVVFEHTPASMGGWLFESSGSLTSVTFNDDIAIPDGMFSGCTKLESVTFNADVTSLGAKAFSGCAKLQEIDLPSTVSSIGEYAFASCKLLSSIVLPEGLVTLGQRVFDSCTALETVTFPTNSGFTTIPQYCFDSCTNLTSASIPSNVTAINHYAFRNCGFTTLPTGWGRAGITYGEYVFKGCPVTTLTFPDTMTSVPAKFCEEWSGLESVVLGSGITEISSRAFYNCTKLSSITLNEGLITIGQYAFRNCSSLSAVSFPPTVTNIAGYAFELAGITGATLPSSLTTLEQNAFRDCKSLATVVFPTSASFTTIRSNVFYGCSSLTTADIPSNVTRIEVNAFQNCGFTSLPLGWDRDASIYTTDTSTSAFAGCPIASVTFPDTWTAVPKGFCVGWSSLEEVNLGSGVTALGDYAFSSCASLTDGSRIDVSNVSSFGTRCFYKSKLTSLPAGINRSGLTIGNDIFLDATALTSADLSNWTDFPYQCFRGCTSLASADLSGAVTLAGYVFCACPALASVDIGSNVTTIGSDVFNGCTTISITVRAANPPSAMRITNDPGKFVPTIYVPAGSVEAYKAAANWSTWADYITAIP